MAGDRLDIVCPRTAKDGKTYFTKIGVAWPMKNGGYSLSFEALPIPTLNDGALEVRALAMPPRGDAPPRRGATPDRAPDGPGDTGGLDDEIPF